MITIVVGAQYGGEGKGKVCAYLASTTPVDVACRCGGPNSSHTVHHDGRSFRLRMMPAAAVVRPSCDVVFGAGTLIHVRTLLEEREALGAQGRLLIDPLAGIVSDDIVAEQRKDEAYQEIGSTLTGTGYAAALRARRRLKLAREEPELRPFLYDVPSFLEQALAKRKRLLVEGHQGYGLSNYHGDYPYCSSRDSTAAAMLSELGIGPLHKRIEIVLAVKIFPTRNHNGSLAEEISEVDADTLGIVEEGGGSWGIANRRRRVGVFDANLVKRAIFANSPTSIALTGADYYDRILRGATRLPASSDINEFLRMFRKCSNVPVRFLSTGPGTSEMIDLAERHQLQAGRVEEDPRLL